MLSNLHNNISQTNLLKIQNRKRILHIFRENGVLSINQLSETTGLSKTTVQKIAEYLLASDFLLDEGKGDSTYEGGKKPQLYSFNAKRSYIFTTQIFDTNLLSAITDLKAEVLAEERTSFPTDESLESVTAMIDKSLHRLLEETGLAIEAISAIVIGCHGVTDPENGVVITSPHFASWGENFPIRRLVADRLGSTVPIHIDNWMRYQAYAEMAMGQGSRTGSFIIVDCFKGGIASGMIRDGEIIRGERFLAGEIGHMTVAPGGPRCACGGRGCLEAMASLAVLERQAAEALASGRESQLAAGSAPSFRDISSAAWQGDGLADELVQKAAFNFAVAFANVSITFDPQKIIFQGDFVNGGEYFLDAIRKNLQDMSLPRMPSRMEICFSNLCENRGIRGGAMYAIDILLADPLLFA